MDEIIRKTQAADLRGKLIRTMKRIKKLPKDSQEIMAGEYEMVSKWKDLTTKKEFDEEKQDYISAQLSSVVLPILEESEEEHKADEKKAKAKKEIKKEEEDDDDEDLLGYGDMKSELKMMKMRSAIDEAKADRAEARRRMDEEHQARMQALKSGGGGGFIGDGSSNNPMGLVYERIITFKHDEDGNVVVGENGQPIPESMRQIPVNPNAIVQSRGRGGDGGEASTIKLLETAVKLVKGDDDKKDDVLKELKEERKVFMDKISQLTNESRDKEIYSNMNKLAGAVGEINKKLEDDTDSFDSYLEMQEKLKEKNIYPDGGNSPEVRRIDLEIEKEKSRRSMDLMMMGKTFKMAETAIKQVTDGPIAKSMAKKIDQSDVIAEEEELPEDEELEADIEEEVAPQQEQPPVEKKSTRKIRGKTKKKRE